MSNVELDISGMTCAACANRIERKLNKLDGVVATVNYATEKAKVTVPAGVDTELLLVTVEQAGYGATVHDDAAAPVGDDELEALRRRLIVAAALAVPVIVLAMAPALQFPGWQWVSLVLATPVVGWSALPFHRAALTNLRHGGTTMDTLVSMGVTAAYAWSVIALVFGAAARSGWSTRSASPLPATTGSAASIWRRPPG